MAILKSITNRMMTATDIQHREVSAPVDEAEYEQVVAALTEQRAMLARIDAELATAANQYEELTLDSALGQKVAAADLTKLETRQKSLEKRRHAAVVAIDHLEARAATWAATQRHRDLEAATARLQAIDAKTPAVEAQCVAAQREVIAALEAARAHRRAYDDALVDYKQLGGARNGDTTRPRETFVLTERGQRGERAYDLAAALEQWITAPERRRQVAERERANYVRAAEEARRREERLTWLRNAPSWERPDGADVELGDVPINAVPSPARKGAA